ncbi:MAG TPA: efflux RND transporter permease subunit [Parvularculaceae bacterium]|nr:efflux RND transporter permease subunit [Parvularculaceae bacterium]
MDLRNISAWAIKNPIPPIVLFLALTVAGLMAYSRLPVNQSPNIEFGIVNVTVTEAGASPSDLETQVTQQVEAALTGVTGVDHLYSTVSQGVSKTTIQLQIGADVSRAVEDARDAVARIRSELPQEVDEPQVSRFDTSEQPIAYFAVENPAMTAQDLTYYVDRTLTRELLTLKGVSAVQRLGGVDREIRVALDPNRLEAFGITADEVNRQLRITNIDLPGGRAELGGQAQLIRTLGGAETVDALATRLILLPDGRSVRLRDLGEVSDTASEPSRLLRFNGQSAIGIFVQRTKGSSGVDVAERVIAKVNELDAKGPVHFKLIGSDVDFIKGLHEGSIEALIEGAFLAVMMVFVFLRDWRATLISAVAIPLATIPTFAALPPLDFTLNIMTLIALALVAGVLVDDAIVEIENIFRHMAMGKKPYQAALEAADEIGLAVVATSATIIAVFLPVSFMGGQTGVWFREFGITVAVAVFFSLLVARLITPMMAAYFLKSAHGPKKPSFVQRNYDKALRFSLRHPVAPIAAGVFSFVAAVVAMTQMPMTFIPRIDDGTLSLQAEFPPGTTLANADRVLSLIAAKSRKVPEVVSVFTSASSANGAVSKGSVNYQLTPREDRKRTDYEVQQAIRPLLASIPDVRLSFQNFSGGSNGADIDLEMKGDDPTKVMDAAEKLVAAMRRKLPQLTEVRASTSLKVPELEIRPKSEEAARLGVSAASIASALRIATSGDIDRNVAKFDASDRQVPIRVRLRDSARTDIDVIRGLRVPSANGGSVRLDSVADIQIGVGVSTIERTDRQRSVTVFANLLSGQPAEALKAIRDLPEAKNLPAGVTFGTSGNTEALQDSTQAFASTMFWGLLLVYLVLVLLFRDFFQPLTIMTGLPLCLAGAAIGLAVTGQPISLFVFIGIVMLVGIVTKNSILLVDFAVEQRNRGVPIKDALYDAGLKRARPIIMTTLAMSAGMLPVAAGFGADGSLRQGMGVAVIGGLLFSTFLSLLFVPAAAIWVDRLERLILRLLRVKPRLSAEPERLRAAAE